MNNTIKNKDLKAALIFAAIGLAAGYFTGMYQVSIATEEFKQQIISQIGSMNTMMLIIRDVSFGFHTLETIC